MTRRRLRRIAATLLMLGLAALSYGAFSETGSRWVARAGANNELGATVKTFRDWMTGAAIATGRVDLDRPSYRFDESVRGDILATVAATGSLNPVATVLVGTQVSGQVKEIYVDFNDEVRQGQPVALIDPVSFEIAVEQAQADLDVARAAVTTQHAAIERLAAALETARFDHQAARANSEGAHLRAEEEAAESGRTQALGRLVSDSERERAASAHKVALAFLRSTRAIEGAREALVRQAEAEIRAAHSQLANLEAVARQRDAGLRHARIELERTVIRSPVDGVVIHRDVEVGQIVAASLQAPTLFTIAQDLRDMQVYAAIDESEIGRIAPWQRVEFTVDAYRDRHFTGTVDQIRKSPRTAQNVVTYTVVVKARNPDLLLLPGMTASARFIVAERTNVVKVPNAALRFRPPDLFAPRGAHVWVENGVALRPIEVRVGLTDGTHSEVSGDGLDEGLRIVIGVERPRREQSTAKRLIGIL